MSWGSLSTFDSQTSAGWGASPPPPPGADPVSAVADLATVGAQIGELISANKFKNLMLRQARIDSKESKIEARRQAKYARRDQARAQMLQARLAALTSITGARTRKSVIAVVGIVALALVFTVATKPKQKTVTLRTT